MRIRIAKYISETGYASRRKAEDLITSGKVKVNDKIVLTPVFFVSNEDKITIDNVLLKKKDNIELYAFHKPLNTITSRYDTLNRKTIYDVIPNKYKQLKYIGRLDYKTTGLLFLTNSGFLSRELTLPSNKIQRKYIAVVKGSLTNLYKARNGITVNNIKYLPMNIKILEKNILEITITEGKKNEIRIVMKACGLIVEKLHRISFGNIFLDDLEVGQIRKISNKRIDELMKFIVK